MSKQENRFDDIRTWATVRGLYANGSVEKQFIKLCEEMGELAQGIMKQDSKLIDDSIGDIVVVLTNLAHLHGTTIESCIELAWNEIKDRQGKMENGTFVKDK